MTGNIRFAASGHIRLSKLAPKRGRVVRARLAAHYRSPRRTSPYPGPPFAPDTKGPVGATIQSILSTACVKAQASLAGKRSLVASAPRFLTIINTLTPSDLLATRFDYAHSRNTGDPADPVAVAETLTALHQIATAA